MSTGQSEGVTRRSAMKAGWAAALAKAPLGHPAIAAAKKTVRVLVVADPFYYALREVTGQFEAVAGSQPQPIVHMYSELAASMGVEWFKQLGREVGSHAHHRHATERRGAPDV